MKRQSEHRPTLTFSAAVFWFTFTEYMRPDRSKGYSSLLNVHHLRKLAFGTISPFFRYTEYRDASSEEHRRHCQRYEHHLHGDVSAHDCGELSRRQRSPARRAY